MIKLYDSGVYLLNGNRLVPAIRCGSLINYNRKLKNTKQGEMQ